MTSTAIAIDPNRYRAEISSMCILPVEGDLLLEGGIRAGLQQQGFQVDWVHDSEAAWRELRTGTYVAAILDLGLPHIGDVNVLQEMRGTGIAVPIPVLTARGMIPDRVRGLDLGADDCIAKPIDLHELNARLRALMCHTYDHPAEWSRTRGTALEPASRTVFCNGRTVALSTREFGLLHALMLDTRRVLSREQFEQCLYPWRWKVGSNSVGVHIHHLHVKLGSDFIVTVRGVGYMLPRDNAEAP